MNPRSAKSNKTLSSDSLVHPISGVTPFTTIDFPNRLAAVFYAQGCPWRCRYCFNSHLWPLQEGKFDFDSDEIQKFLSLRQGFLDGIVFSGGEPTLHPQLASWMQRVKEMGYEVGLHTSGMFPERLEEVLPLCDWVGMDLKAPFDHYERITQVERSGESACKSVSMIVKSGVDYEFRTTVHPLLLSEEDLLQMGRELSSLGAECFVLQEFRRSGCNDDELCNERLPALFISRSVHEALGHLFKTFFLRHE
ncbi:MAG: anaerobic ribonucleoside-triphosphate reductase activating protein [Omnitrophica bacterium RIFCSPLOWO2_12_FULL_50_11]|nr:MAG: anaerobic ribonucleoside-triphosphate reductase activating protein [Omnitrophica bacterium RIFCSPLOWO2_12_FULL_50_11]